jgi:hypothetical protein
VRAARLWYEPATMPRLLAIAAACVALAALGCGDGTPDANQPLAGGGGTAVDQFRGTWRFDQAAATLNCQGSPPSRGMPAGNIVLEAGTTAPLVATSPFGIDASAYCDFELDIVDDFNAHMRDGQTCLLPAIGWTIQPTSAWRFTLLGPDQAEESGVAAVSTSSGNCGYVEMATLTRIVRN